MNNTRRFLKSKIIFSYEKTFGKTKTDKKSNKIIQNRMAYVYSLNEVGKFADAIGEDSSPYYSKADEILPTAEAHFNGDYVYESTNRQVVQGNLVLISSKFQFQFRSSFRSKIKVPSK